MATSYTLLKTEIPTNLSTLTHTCTYIKGILLVHKFACSFDVVPHT